GKPSYELLPPEPERGLSLLPVPSPNDVFFDMEGDPYLDDGREYLFGMHYREGSSWIYRPLWGHDPEAEKRALEQFLDFVCARLARDPALHVYHYAHYESTALKRLAARYGTREEALDELLRRKVFVDLYRVVRQGLRSSPPSDSLKDLEIFY